MKGEVGRGADHFDVEKFDADFAYTMDGDTEGEIQYENFFNAIFEIKGMMPQMRSLRSRA